MLQGSFTDLIRPDGCLYFSDMGFSEIKHADTGLTDTAADGVGQFFLQNCFLERKLRPCFASGELQLLFKSLFVHTDSHGGQFQCVAEDRIPDDDIAV